MEKTSPLTDTAEKVAQNRYYHKNDENNTTENWADLSDRVVNHVCAKETDNFKRKIRSLIYNTKFLPNSPCLVNAGRKGKTRGLLACQPGWVRINTFEGLVRLDSLVENQEIRDIPTFTGNAKITNRWHNGKKPVLQIETEKGYRLFVTPDHQVYTIPDYASFKDRNKKKLKSLCCWDKADNLKIGDALILDFSEKPFPKNYIYTNSVKVDEDLARILAFTKCDGHLKYHQCGLKKWPNKTLVFEIIVDSEESLNLIKNSSHMYGNIIDINNAGKNVFLKRVRAYGEKYAYLFDFGKFGSLDCDIPEEIFRSPKKVVAEFCKAAWDCEGTVAFGISSKSGKKNAHITIGMISETFIRDMQKLLNLFGIQSSVYGPVYDNRNNPNRHAMYYLAITNTVHLKKFSKEIGFISSRKNRMLSDYLELVQDKNYDKFAFKIKKITDIGEHDVYDISTSNETYLSEGIVVHNCFVTKAPEDTWVDMVDNIANFGHIARQGGGCGVSLSNIRPEGDPVFGSTHAKACGPIEHMRMVSEVMSSITQSGFRGMAMMATMAVDHPDIMKFIVCKQHDRALKTLLKEDIFGHYDQMKEDVNKDLTLVLDKFLSNFNISVVANDEFMQKVQNDEDFELCFNGKVYQTLKAKEIFNAIVTNAWKNGDPGLLFYSMMNSSPYKYSKQMITATNPCFHGDSMVAVADGRNFVSIKQLAKEEKDVPVYCCDPETGNIHIKWGRKPRKTRKNASLCKVIFHDGGEIITTPDHKILLRNGEYKEVNMLNPGDSIMPMTKFEYISHRSKYLGIVKGDGQSTKTEHRMVYEFHNESLNDNELIHHKDFDGLNNCISNLQKMGYSEHSEYHRQFNNPMTHWYPNATAEEKQRYHDNMSKSTSGDLNGMFGKKHSEQSKREIGNKTLDRFKDDEYRAFVSHSMKEAWKNPELKSRQSNNKKRNWKEGKYDSLRAEIVTRNCLNCGESFSVKSFSRKKYCSVECGNMNDISRSEIINGAIDFVEKRSVYPSVSTWNNFDDVICSREKIRKEFKNFETLSEILIDMGIFAGITKNTKMSSKMISAAMVNWTIQNGKEPTKKDVTSICSEQSIYRNGGFKSLLEQSHQLCETHAVNHKVVSVEILNETDDVYNITVDDFHNLCILSKVVNKFPHVTYSKRPKNASRYYSVVYKNCGEQQLPEYGSCNLGSIDVSKFYDNENNRIDWVALRDAIRLSIQFLDDVIDANTFPTPDFTKWAKQNRPVGLGVMGFADLLLKMRIAYGSARSFQVAEELIVFFEKESHKKSVELGKERGTPKCCRFDELEHRRNVTTLSIAPTGSISLLAGCSSAIEPIFSPVIHRYDNTGSYEMPHPDADKRYFRCAVDPNGEKEVTWKDHVDMQSIFQKHVDSAISKTINMSNSATEEDIFNAYMLAWKKGCKGITIYRDGCKTTQVLNTNRPSRSKFKADHAPKRPKELKCDVYKTRADGYEWHILIGKYDEDPYELFAVNGKTNLSPTGRIIKNKRRHYSLLDEDGNCIIENLVEEESEIDHKISLETRRFSLELRHGIPPKYIVQQIDRSNEVITSFSKAVGRIFKKKYLTSDDQISIAGDVACPDCAKNNRQSSLIPDSGCWKCPVCSFSKCG